WRCPGPRAGTIASGCAWAAGPATLGRPWPGEPTGARAGRHRRPTAAGRSAAAARRAWRVLGPRPAVAPAARAVHGLGAVGAERVVVERRGLRALRPAVGSGRPLRVVRRGRRDPV